MRVMVRGLGGLALLAALAASASGQSIGVKGGWAHSNFTGSDAQGASALNTVAGGGFLELMVTPVFAVEVDALYAQKGAQETVEGVNGKVKLKYLEIPLLGKVIIPLEGSRVAPELFVGPYIAFKTGCDIKGSEGSVSVSLKCSDADLPVKSTDVGLTLGGGVSFPLSGKISGLLDARYDLGLTKIDDTSPPSNVKNGSLMVFVGISIPIGSSPRGNSAVRR